MLPIRDRALSIRGGRTLTSCPALQISTGWSRPVRPNITRCRRRLNGGLTEDFTCYRTGRGPRASTMPGATEEPVALYRRTPGIAMRTGGLPTAIYGIE